MTSRDPEYSQTILSIADGRAFELSRKLLGIAHLMQNFRTEGTREDD